MTDPTNERDIEGLLGHLVDGQQEYALLTSKSAHAYHAALIALLAERNSLKQRVSELESQEFLLPSDPFRDADRELRERLVCAALTAIVMAEASYADAAEGAVRYADATLAAMRKGDSDAK